jgi:hypothetical protein
MEDFKKRLYNYEADPPAKVWNSIHDELHGSEIKIRNLSQLRKKSKFVFYGLTAAASLIIIFLLSVVVNNSRKNQYKKSSISENESQVSNITPEKIQDSIVLNNKILEDIIKNKNDKNLLAQNDINSLIKAKKYITVAGPGGQPVKISPKVATLIESADNEFPPKPVWNKKIEKWKEIMLSSTISPTSTTLIDVVQSSPVSYDSNDN